MPEDWASVAADITAAIASVGFAATLETPGANTGTNADPIYGAATLTEITVIDDQIKRRDATGLVTETVRVLTMSASVVPAKGWRVQVLGQWHRIAKVMPLAPGGTDLLVDVELEG